MTDQKNEWARLIMSAAIVGYFGWALIAHWSNGIEETLKSAFMIAVGFWLGSSKGSAEKSAALGKAVDSPAGTPNDPVTVVEGDKP
jgi:hypothetical protein